MLVDVTPGVNADKASPITAFVDGPESFENFDELLARTMEHNPSRSESSLAPRHPAQRRPAGGRNWVWRYAPSSGVEPRAVPDYAALWEDVSSLTMPLLLVRGLAWSVVDDEDVDELLRRRPGATVVGVEGAGHSVQGDRPLELARIIDEFPLRHAVMDARPRGRTSAMDRA